MSKKVIVELFDDNGWVECPQVPHSQWQEAVGNGDTQMGYAYFVASQLEQNNVDFRFADTDLEDEVYSPLPQLPSNISDELNVEVWMSEVENLDTRRGYRHWVLAKIEQLQNDHKYDSAPSKPRRKTP